MTVDLSIDARARVDVDVDSVSDGRATSSSSSSSSSASSSSSSSSTSLLPPVDVLFVWDFDWTIVNCNSDEYIPASFLGDEETERRLRDMIGERGHEAWHECVSDLVNYCLDENDGLSIDDVRAAAAKMPYLIDVRRTIEDVDDYESSSCGQAIISDGNDYFIGAFLRENGMDRRFTHGVETNAGRWESRVVVDDDVIGGGKGGGGAADATTGGGRRFRFRVVHQSSKYGGHDNERCPPNLCKTQALLDILGRTTAVAETTANGGGGSGRPRVVYVGDGSNDACPALHVLDERDVLLARAGRRIRDPNSKSGEQTDEGDANALTGDEFPILSTIEKRMKREALAPRCRVLAWNSGRQLRSLVRDILDERG